MPQALAPATDPLPRSHRQQCPRQPCRPRTTALLLACVAAAAHAQPADLPPDARRGSATALEVSEDGHYVIDRRARLLWPRCVEGMHWNGKDCTGMPQLFTHKQAQALAAERARQDGVRWRLPRVNELRRLISRDIRPQGLSPELFPGAPRGWHWTGTAAVNARPVNPYNYSNISGSAAPQLSAQQAWAIDLDSLESRPDMGRGNQLLVRLVRPLPSDQALAPTPPPPDRPGPGRPDPDAED